LELVLPVCSSGTTSTLQGETYVIIEQRASAGSFFEFSTRWRQLWCINKRYSGRLELDHSLRHDWNSLLSDPSHAAASSPAQSSSTAPHLTLSTAEELGWLLFRNYSQEYYPQADALVEYLRKWAIGLAPQARPQSGRPYRPLNIRLRV